jgi:5-methylcytosine-specific restriction endonuclease McrBC GTP-binding regulatory subunit McrB
MIAYNKKLVLANTAPGLDFTLDQPHEVVPILSGIANYHYSKWVAWRTAFREVIKLKHSLPNVENEYRLAAWLDKIGHEQNHIENGEYSVYGAEDAVEYYDAVKGKFSELKKSYDWDWLASYAFVKRNLIAV